jgi:5'-3' exonuclease
MGIKNLNKFLQTKCPTIFEYTHLSFYAYKKIAIDISLYLHKFKAVCGERWITAFINLIISLRRNEIHCVFIFDGKAPPEKDLERAKRGEEKEKLELNMYKFDEAMNEYENTGNVSEILRQLWIKRRPSHSLNLPKRLLGQDVDKIDMVWIKNKIEQKRNQIIDISEQDIVIVKQLFDIMNVPYYTATGEAEKLCAKLCRNELVYAVLSEDTDLIAYQTPRFLTKIDTSEDTCILLEYNNILGELNLTTSQMIDLCIMCGTDYNANIPRVGSQTAYKYIQTHGTIEEISKNMKLDINILNHIRGRELFTTWDPDNITSIPYCGKPNIIELKKFISDNSININVDSFSDIFESKIIIEE